MRTHALEDHNESGSCRIDADVFDDELAFLRKNRRRDEKCRGRRICGHGDLERWNAAGRRLITDGTVTLVNLQPQMSEQTLGMIARAIRLPNGDRHPPGEPCKEQRTLDLRAGHGARVGEPAQHAAPDCER